MESPNRKQKHLNQESEYKLICEVDKELRKMIDIAPEFGIKTLLSRIFKKEVEVLLLQRTNYLWKSQHLSCS